jgi:hypothetical protein
MLWEKKGLIYEPDKAFWWSQEYGILPTPIYLPEKEVIRVYFGTADATKNSRITFIDVSASNPSQIVYLHHHFILDIGDIGYFDDSGVVPTGIVEVNQAQFLYYVGFQRAEKVPAMLFIGLATSTDYCTFRREKKFPLLDRSIIESISNGAAFVLFQENKFKMWFWSSKQWIHIQGKLYLQASIFYAESLDGVHWSSFPTPCITYDIGKEFSVGRPWVVYQNNQYEMFYSIRYKEKLYRLGYATSPDGIYWERRDEEIGIDVSETGWDADMICYPAVITVHNRTYLFYNGNGNGKTGFGYAELVK